jgi:hypothetical protein
MHLPELADIDEIKSRMPVTYLLHVAGQAPQARQGRDLMYLTPWRQDSNASLACYQDNDGGIVDRWKDMARSEGGDVLDMIGMMDESRRTFGERMEMARDLYQRFLADAWVAPQPEASTGSFDVDAARAEMAQWYIDRDEDLLESWLVSREDAVSGIPAGWLRARFGVVAVGGEIKAPYLDSDGELVAYKHRKPGEKFKSAAGTRGLWTSFYGEHLDIDMSVPVVVCEGEPDVWSGTHATENFVFLGLPTGAGTRPEKMQSRLSGRRILLALDGDTAGRDASVLWAPYLATDNEVEIVPVPEGKDLSSVANIPALLDQARPFEAPMPGLITVASRYLRANRDGTPGMQLSDFVLSPTRVLQSTEGALSYEVSDGRRTHLILSADLMSKNTMRRWSADRGLTWAGSDTDVALVSSALKSASLFVPQEGASDVAGLNESHIVWDGGSIGDSPVRYVPGASKVSLDIRVSESAPADHRLLYAMREMNDHKVTDPILAWAAAAPFRSLLPQFPILNVAGTSGSGKTTTVQAIIPTLTGSHIFQTLSSSTPYAVESLVNSTNGFPVVFDEYRPGARTATLERLEQLARDAYDGQPSAKSAGGDRWNEIAYIRTDAPIVIAGEQSITETSHAERMILVQVRRPGVRSAAHQRALEYIRSAAEGGLAFSYLSFVVRQAQEGGRLHYPPVGDSSLPDRVRYNLGVLDLGWRLLNDFLSLKGSAPLEDPDWSGVVDTTVEVTATNPTIDALEWALGDRFAGENVWVDGDELIVQVAGFVADVKRSGSFVLPGNNGKTISDLLQSDYDARPGKRIPPLGSKQKRVWVMSADRVFSSGVE